jgi:hypothetical protein
LSLGLVVTGALGCRRSASEPIGLADSYLLFSPDQDPAGHARRGPSGLPMLEALALDDSRAEPLHQLFAVGFVAELLRTDYLRKQFVREAQAGGKRFAPAAQAAAAQPTVFVLGGDALSSSSPAGGRGLATTGFFGGASERPDIAWIALSATPESDSALAQTVSGRLGRSIAAALAAGGAPVSATPAPGAPTAARPGPSPAPVTPVTAALPLIDGYASAMEVIAREWRNGDGPRGTLAPDAGTAAQRDIFAAVRQNRYVMRPGGGPAQLRSGAEMLREPGVAATVLYRMAQSKGVGHRVAPAEIYAPFVSQRIPNGISPAAVLGPFRNFQAKLIAAWGRAVLRGAPPRDIADLVEAYATELPAERAEVIRLFVITTFAATVKRGGVVMTGGGGAAPGAGDPLAELTALAAEVAAGRRPLRGAVDADN